MTPHKQLLNHDPANGSYGDCHRTCIACLLDVPPENVPFLSSKWLSERGLREVMIPVPGDKSLQGILNDFSMMHIDLHFMVQGNSPRGGHHVVIACNGEIVHDPSASGGGLVGPCDDGYWWLSVLARAT